LKKILLFYSGLGFSVADAANLKHAYD